MTLADALREYIEACFTGLWIESHEHDDALVEIARLASAEKWRLAIWDLDQGLRDEVAARLTAAGTGPVFERARELVLSGGELGREEASQAFGEALPEGLVLVES